MTIKVSNLVTPVLAVISIINLVEDAKLISLQENLATWFGAYDRIVSTIFHTILGWISLPGFAISPVEQHFIVIFTLMTSAMVRGVLAVPRNSTLRQLGLEQQRDARPDAQGFVPDVVLPAFAMLLYAVIYTALFGTFDPLWGGVLSVLVGASFILRHVYIRNSPLARGRRLRAILQELGVVVALSLMFIFANYFVMQFF